MNDAVWNCPLVKGSASVGAQRCVLAYLWSRSSLKAFCYPGLDRISDCTGSSRSTVIRALDDLAAQGYVKVTASYQPGGRQTSSLYAIRLDAIQSNAEGCHGGTPGCRGETPGGAKVARGGFHGGTLISHGISQSESQEPPKPPKGGGGVAGIPDQHAGDNGVMPSDNRNGSAARYEDTRVWRECADHLAPEFHTEPIQRLLVAHLTEGRKRPGPEGIRLKCDLVSAEGPSKAEKILRHAVAQTCSWDWAAKSVNGTGRETPKQRIARMRSESPNGDRR